ncbi:uncharacterized protein EI97DRAFT_469078 [Westerdykella ornata]|uniref:DNA mismatch repair protein HSM3 N-terminal domain-containing protein n=1 Tax=Westerdykella ornata TaxID=318751 RepID=A0A6A6JC25_WESOR|nr:uncharacterized protein EI97DRAFT_469078 [Westerdykella ornata]KAF2274121.1 hypothetical protein EI97DRAFT_469078 [Westerdykella ornata]
MATTTVLDALSAHLKQVQEDPSIPLDESLIEKGELYTSTNEYRQSAWTETKLLFQQLAILLPNLQQDPSPLIRFILKLTTPYTFDDIKDLDFEIGLQLAAEPFHSLLLSLLEKAASNSSHVQMLANRPNIVYAIVRLWLCTKDTAVATQAADLLVSLLRASKDESMADGGEVQVYQYGRAPIWKRLFHDQSIYRLYYHYTSIRDISQDIEPVLDKSSKTIAQGRLLQWLYQVGQLSWEILTASHMPEIERKVGLAEGQGLLHYAALKMVDTADDVLMHLTLIDFFADLIKNVKTPTQANTSSVSLDFLKEHNIHKSIIDNHTAKDRSLEQGFLHSRTAHYIAEYVSSYPDDSENSAETLTIRQYVQRKVRELDPSDLSIIAAMPRTSLIPRHAADLRGDGCVVLNIPFRKTTPDALKTLAAVFHGPQREEITFPLSSAHPPASPARISEERVCARLLTYLYLTKNPTFFSDLISHADTVAMTDTALASLTVLSALITSNWETGSPSQEALYLSDDPTAIQQARSFPHSGVALVLDSALSGAVLPYLLRPPKSFSNLVGGRGGAENAAYKVAVAKFDVVKLLYDGLVRAGEGGGGYGVVVDMLRRRINEGVWGNLDAAGSRIATLGA